MKATETFLAQQEALYEKRKQEILQAKDSIEITGTTYYVSACGDDANDGLSPETPWKTLQRVNEAKLLPGDGVRFRRGDLFRGGIDTTKKPGVTYCAYGEGPKPRFYGWDEDLACADLWEEADAEHRIWKYKKPINDPGTLVFNHGEKHSRKLIPTFRNMKFVCREDESRDFVMAEEMTEDLDIFWKFADRLTTEPSKGEDFPIPVTGPDCYGELWLRCDKGNPGEVFSSIESVARRVAFRVLDAEGITVDNLCMKYYCFAVSAWNAQQLHVTNCEIGWIGGNIQHYDGTDPNFPEGKRGTVTRYGNGIEVYGSCRDYLVENCWIYQSYDAGASHQVSTAEKLLMTDVLYKDNLIEECVYAIEYFLELLDGETESLMDGIVMCGNILRKSGYGWGQQRHNKDTPALIKGWSYPNPARNFEIYGNTFDRCAYRMIHTVAAEEASCPDMHDNIYIQDLGGCIGKYGGNRLREPEDLLFDENAEEKIAKVLKDRNARVYWIS